MKGSFAKVGYVGLIAGAISLFSVFQVYGSAAPTVFQACLTDGGALIQVSVQAAHPACPTGTTPVSWNQAGTPGPTGGLNAIRDITANTTFVVPAGINRLMVEAWGGGGGGGAALQFPDCVSGGGGGGGGYFRAIVPVTPGESLTVVIGSGGAPGAAGSQSAVKRGTITVVSAGGGAGASTSGGAGGAVSATGIVRTGAAGGDGSFDSMCAMGPGNPPGTPPGNGGSPIQGSVATQGGGSAGGRGDGFTLTGFGPAQPGLPGEVVLTW
jgi:hypothetical protein